MFPHLSLNSQPSPLNGTTLPVQWGGGRGKRIVGGRGVGVIVSGVGAANGIGGVGGTSSGDGVVGASGVDEAESASGSGGDGGVDEVDGPLIIPQ